MNCAVECNRFANELPVDYLFLFFIGTSIKKMLIQLLKIRSEYLSTLLQKFTTEKLSLKV